jgi:hypothetical protein
VNFIVPPLPLGFASKAYLNPLADLRGGIKMFLVYISVFMTLFRQRSLNTPCLHRRLLLPSLRCRLFCRVFGVHYEDNIEKEKQRKNAKIKKSERFWLQM